jgi:hypothetical protein
MISISGVRAVAALADRRIWRDLAAGAKDVVDGVQLGSGTGVGTRAVDVALRGGHGLVAEELHQCVDADVRIGEFSGEGVAQTEHQGTGGPIAVDASFLEGTQDPVLQSDGNGDIYW